MLGPWARVTLAALAVPMVAVGWAVYNALELPDG